MGQCACFNTQQTKLIQNTQLPEIKEATVTNKVKYMNVRLQRRLVHIYCLNLHENISLDVIQMIMIYYSTNNMDTNPILIKHQKVDSHYGFKHQIIGSQDPQNMYKRYNHIPHKILLLGNPNSGKSTIFNQLRYIYDGVDQVELQNSKRYLSQNTFETIRILAIFSDIFQDPDCSVYPSIKDTTVEPQNRLIRDRISRMASNETLTSKDYDDLIQLTKDKGIQKTLHCRSRMEYWDCCLDSYKQVFPNMKYYKQKDYVQTIDDFLWTYLWTYTPNRFNYEYNTSLYEIHDVPGGKNDRREWISLLNNVSILMFVINLDGYHRVYRNDCRYPREDMRDTIELLGGLLRYTQMTKCLILIFNKIDLFEESITHIDFKEKFSDFKGDTRNKVEIINFIFCKCLDRIERNKGKHNIT
eukprot:292728_1